MTTYSRYWRKNRSGHEATELALSLRALRKVAVHIGKIVKPVFWKGMVDADNTAILLDADMVQGRYPIPFKDFDILVAKVAFEGLASIEMTDWIREKVISSIPDLSENDMLYLKALLQAAESIYLDELARSHVWGLYLSNLWLTEFSVDQRDPRLPPGPARLGYIWMRKAILGQYPDQLHYFYDEVIDLLTNHTSAIRDIVLLPSLSTRRKRRSELYLDMWSGVYEIISEWEEFQLNSDALNMLDEADAKADPSDEENNKEAKEGENQATGALEWDLAEEVRSIMEEGETNLTRDVAVATHEAGARPIETIIKSSEIRSNIRPDELQIQRLKKIFKDQESLIKRSRRRKIRRGLIEGKLDARRLYRVPFDVRVFKNKQTPCSEYLWQICIVADASASMADKSESQTPWFIAEKTFASIAEAALFRNALDIYAYSAEKNICTLTQLWHGGKLYTLMPAGRTPSGQAIMAAATLLNKKFNRKQKKKMIIHITDGAANCGLPLSDAVKYCRRNNIEAYTIGCGCTPQTRNFLRESFPVGHVYFMKNINYLSAGLEHLFKRKILNQSILVQNR
jgi:hypothetical protein